MTEPSAHADGVLPNDVVRSPFAHGVLTFVRLRPDLDVPSVQQFLTDLTALQTELMTPFDDCPLASVTIGFSNTFFQVGDTARFGIAVEQIPTELSSLAPVPDTEVPADLVIYVVALAEATIAQFLLGLSRLHDAIEWATVERGFQRATRRELGGFLDGLRNVPREERDDYVFTDGVLQPDDPGWSHGGSYMAYIKIAQNLDGWNALGVDAQQAAVGRRKDDGSRLDLAAGTPPDQEGEFGDPNTPALNSHVRKVGPRGAVHDQTRIFRRGLPFVELTDNGSVTAGLQFVSFQASLAQFTTVFQSWMTNPAFIQAGVGPDALESLIQFLKSGFYFVPPHDDRYICAGAFDPPIDRCKRVGRLVVQKRVVDTQGQPVAAELGGIVFEVRRKDTGEIVGTPFATNSHGRAVSPDLPLDEVLVLHEAQPPQNFDPAPDQDFTLHCPSMRIDVQNVAKAPGPGYGG